MFGYTPMIPALLAVVLLLGVQLGTRQYIKALPWILVLVAGLLNFSAILVNGHHMPVLVPHQAVPTSDHMHVDLTASSHLKFLCDVHGWPGCRYSLGDVVATLGLGIWVVTSFWRKK